MRRALAYLKKKFRKSKKKQEHEGLKFGEDERRASITSTITITPTRPLSIALPTGTPQIVEENIDPNTPSLPLTQSNDEETSSPIVQVGVTLMLIISFSVNIS
jgi:hypothetical protein